MVARARWREKAKYKKAQMNLPRIDTASSDTVPPSDSSTALSSSSPERTVTERTVTRIAVDFNGDAWLKMVDEQRQQWRMGRLAKEGVKPSQCTAVYHLNSDEKERTRMLVTNLMLKEEVQAEKEEQAKQRSTDAPSTQRALFAEGKEEKALA